MRSMHGLAALAVGVGLLLAGCGSSKTHQISGSVSGAVAADVTVALSGASTATTTTSSAGAYAFADLADGNYTVTPSLAGYTFNPASRTVSLSGSDVTGIDFTATQTSTSTFTISGTVTGAATGGVILTLGGAGSGSATTNASGAYAFANVAPGNYTVTPSLGGYTFNPVSKSVSVVAGDVSGVDFTSAAVGTTVQVTSNVTTATTWTPANLYVVDDYITVSATLTIQPGTIIKFGPNGSLYVTGKILADGQAATSPIIFTSLADDAHGGDTNADGTATAPAAGDWQGIQLYGTGSLFNYAEFLYGGAGDSAALAQSLDTGKVTVTHSTFAHVRGTSAAITASPALDLTSAAAGTVVTANTFFDDTVPLGVNTTFSTDDSNLFVSPDTAHPLPSTFNATMVRGCGSVTASITWGGTHVPYVIGDPVTACNYLTIQGGAHLTVAPGAVVKFFSDGRIVANGLLTADSAGTTPITFTSIKDDDRGGDTNGDGTSSTPAGGDWQGIRLTVSGSVFNHARITYGGGNDYPALEASDESVSVTVTNSVFAHNVPPTESLRAAPALDLTSAKAGTVVTGNIFYGNRIPLGINSTFSLDDSNAFQDPGQGSGQPNQFNAVIIRGCASVSSNITWSVTHAAMVVGDPVTACNYLNVSGGGHLTLGNDVVMKFFVNGSLKVATGATFTVGTGDALTSIADDAHGGDTNGDGTATTPAAGDWSGVFFNYACQNASYIYYADTCT